MVVKRIGASAWAALAIAAAVQITGCEGESETHGGGHKGGGSGGTSAGDTSGGKSGTSGFGGDLGGLPGGGASGKGGSPTGGTGGDAGTAATGGDAGQAGEPGQGGGPGGVGGDAGGGPDDPTVRGRVVDFWLAPLANVPVTIGTTTVTTNAQGTFTVPAVAPEYDADLVVSWPGGQRGVYGWRFEGLTRRDPTLQVYKGRENRSRRILIDAQGETLNASRILTVAVASPNGLSIFEDIGSQLNSDAGWEGPVSVQAHLHALLWEFDTNDLPTVYRSYDTLAVTLDENATMDPMLLPNLADETITSGSVSGSVTTSNTTDRANYAMVRFSDGAVIQVVNDYPGGNSYSYVLPALPSSTLTVAASYGYSSTGAYGVAHREVSAPGQTGVAITIPDAMAQVAPVTGITNVGPTNQFSWSGSAGPCVFHAEDVSFYQGVYVVTSRRTITLPTFGSFALRAGGVHNWRVERHGARTSVDALATPEGYLDSFSRTEDHGEGPSGGDGTYTISTGRNFTMAN